jgi:hypothetical protein
MNKQFVFLGLLGATVLATCGSCFGSEPAATPKRLLETILRLSRAKEFGELSSYVVPVHVGEMKLEEMVVQEIRKNDENSSGDYAYSDLGLEMVLKKHGDAFGPELNEFWKRELSSITKHSPKLKKIAWDQYQILNEGSIHVIVVKIDTSYQLVFWENVNQLLKESRGTAPTKASVENQ